MKSYLKTSLASCARTMLKTRRWADEAPPGQYSPGMARNALRWNACGLMNSTCESENSLLNTAVNRILCCRKHKLTGMECNIWSMQMRVQHYVTFFAAMCTLHLHPSQRPPLYYALAG